MIFERVKNRPMLSMFAGPLLVCAVFIAACNSSSDRQDLQTRVEVAESNITSLQMLVTNTVIEVGQSQQVTLNALSQSDNQGSSVADSAVWSVSNPDIATVDQSGVMTGIADGVVNVMARFGPLFSAISVQVSSADLVSIQITSPVESVNECDSVQLIANGAYNDGLGPRNLTNDVSWSVVGTTALGVFDPSDPSGFFRTSAGGVLSVTASRNGIVADPSFNLEILNNLGSVMIPEPAGILTTSNDLQLSAVAIYTDDERTTADITDNAIWSVANTTVATVDNTLPSRGLVDASQTGSVTVFASCGDALAGMLTLQSGDPDVVESVFFSRTSPQILTFNGTTTLDLRVSVRLETQQTIVITEDSIWTLVEQGNSLNEISNSSGSRGELTIRGTGTIRVQAEYDGDDFEDSTLNIPQLEIQVQ